MKIVRKTASALLDYFRRAYPIFICFFGALIVAVTVDSGGADWLGGSIVAGMSFAWALDLASERARAKARSEMAAQIVAQLTSGEDTEINVHFKREA